jgi:AcrR family transcriptional regulator
MSNMPPTRERTHLRDHDRSTRRAARRVELLDAAVRAIRRDGPSVSMDVIAAEAGVTKPIVYRHFGDRVGLASALAEQFGAALVGELDAALSQDLPPDQLLRATIDTYLAFVERDPQLYSFLVGRLGVPNNDVANGLITQVGTRVALALGEQLRALGIDSGPAEPWAFGIVGMVHLAGDWWLERRTMTRARLVDDITSLLWHGLGGLTPATREEAR